MHTRVLTELRFLVDSANAAVVALSQNADAATAVALLAALRERSAAADNALDAHVRTLLPDAHLDPAEVRIDVYRSGPNTSVRATHLPTGIIADGRAQADALAALARLAREHHARGQQPPAAAPAGADPGAPAPDTDKAPAWTSPTPSTPCCAAAPAPAASTGTGAACGSPPTAPTCAPAAPSTTAC